MTAATLKAPWPWADSLDALIAAPHVHALVFENECVRVLRTRIGPGVKVPLHTHRWPCVMFIFSWSDMIRRDEKGEVTFDTRKVAEAPKLNAPTWQEPLPPHSVENVGETEFHIMQVEIKGVV
jgi:hypothetical protein